MNGAALPFSALGGLVSLRVVTRIPYLFPFPPPAQVSPSFRLVLGWLRIKKIWWIVSKFYIKGEGFFRNALTFKVKPEGISENPLTIYVNVALHKYRSSNIVFSQASENQHGIGRRNRETKGGGAVWAGEGRCSRMGFGIRP